MRLFVGLPAPAVWKTTLEDLTAQWRGRFASRLAWSRPETWHLTLHFLGEVPEAALPAVMAAVKAAALMPAGRAGTGAFPARPAGGGFFPHRRPLREVRVAWAGLGQGAGECVALAEALRDALRDALAPFGPVAAAVPRPFTPHLTLFRVKDAFRRDDPWDELLADLQARTWEAAVMEEAILWRSRLGGGGARHDPLLVVPLAEAAPGAT